MHSAAALRSDDFEIAIGGAPATLSDLLPGFTDETRVGLVVRDTFGAVGASGLLMSAITGFYDIQRSRHPEGFFRYPDYFLFHVDRGHGNHEMLDIYPNHKEVVVPDEPESILRAVNDRGITYLLIPDGTPQEPDLNRETRDGALQRIRAAFAYAPSGRVAQADVEIMGNEHVDAYVAETLDPRRRVARYAQEGREPTEIARARARVDEVDEPIALGMLSAREQLKEAGRTTETLRRIPVSEAISLLSLRPPTDPSNPPRSQLS